MSKEYINRNSLISLLEENLSLTPNIAFILKQIIRILKECPAADVVEVVRCKDCKHRYEPVNCALWYGTLGDKEYFIDRGENFSCSYGEKGGCRK